MDKTISGVSPVLNSDRFEREFFSKAKNNSENNDQVEKTTAREKLAKPLEESVEKPQNGSSDEKDQRISELAKIDEDIKSFLEENNISMEFSIDENTKKMIIKVIDSETEEVIRQFPPEISLEIARSLSGDSEKGFITNVTI